ncbi:unnamed protein product [Arabis nemorensis]|uniref:Glutamate-1-semialdehyde 2,1-aminomutase n=1 Tax=Arabis nemorensis TaxID=586526 RepID=A0A565BU85_9BRAS|nr:unnamed protein product [Arabis nemorensis]
MTGFRLAYGGAQEYFGITPDLTTLGKIIGGGLPMGAYGGRRDIMEMVAPAEPMYQAGTLSGNLLAMTAGIHMLKRLRQPGTYEYLDKTTKELTNGILEAGKKTGHAMCGGYISGLFGFFFTKNPSTISRTRRRVMQRSLENFSEECWKVCILHHLNSRLVLPA